MRWLRSIGIVILVVCAFPSLRLYSFLSYVKCPNKDEDAVIAPPSSPANGIPGTLVICGGGNLPDSVIDAFVQRAGGAHARLVLIPTASPSAHKDGDRQVEFWRKHGIGSVRIVHTPFRGEANDRAFVQPLTEATAVWMRGGDQKLLLDRYKNTLVELELHRLLQRGGVIGGSSAGAAVMSQLAILPGNETPRLAEGFGFLQHAVIDMHFLKRDRLDRLHEILRRNPGRFGIGVDEGTAAIVEGENIRVVGNSAVLICQRGTAEHAASSRVFCHGKEAYLTGASQVALERMPVP